MGWVGACMRGLVCVHVVGALRFTLHGASNYWVERVCGCKLFFLSTHWVKGRVTTARLHSKHGVRAKLTRLILVIHPRPMPGPYCLP